MLRQNLNTSGDERRDAGPSESRPAAAPGPWKVLALLLLLSTLLMFHNILTYKHIYRVFFN